MTKVKIAAAAVFIGLLAVSGTAKAQTKTNDEITLAPGEAVPQLGMVGADDTPMTTNGWYVRYCYSRWYFVGYNYYGRLVYRRYTTCR